MSWGFAGCQVCKDEPLVMTFAFRGREFICLSCGRLYEFFGPARLGESEEIEKKSNERTAEWIENAGNSLLIGQFCREGCDKCSMSGNEYHPKHATVEEWEAHNKAILWLNERTGKDFSSFLREGVISNSDSNRKENA